MGETSLDSFCRLCLKETFTLSDIFSQFSASGDPVYKTLNFLYDLEISHGDGLPSQICTPCVWRMIEFEAYKRNAHCAKEEILKLVNKTGKNVVIKEEEVRLSCKVQKVKQEIPVYCMQSNVDQHKASINSPQNHTDHYHPILSQEMPHGKSEKTLPEVSQETTKITQGWPKIVKDSPTSPVFVATQQPPSIQDSYLSQSGVHFLAMLGEQKERISILPIKAARKPVKPQVDSVNALYPSKSTEAPSQRIDGSQIQHLEDLRCDGYKIEGSDIITATFVETLLLEGKEAFICDICKKSYSEKIHLGEHMKYHYLNRHYFCRVCGDSFQQSRARGRHELLHLKEKVSQKKDKPHTCVTCKKQFSSKSSFYRHCNEHTDKYACPICRKSFSCSKDLKRHTIIHSNEKPFQCSICQRSFNQKGNLNKHMVTHSVERPFDCTMCERKFKTKRERNNHELTHLRRQVLHKASPIPQ